MRKLARQIAFLLIYSSDMGKSDYQTVLAYYLNDKENLEDFLDAAGIFSMFPELDADTLESAIEEDDKHFITDTVGGTMDHLVDIDNMINAQAKNWSTLRMMSADKNILRMGVYELCFAEPKTPAGVVINEAVELAKIYGDDESYKFVNGILDAVRKRVTCDE
ncbi:MAG: transcription antitermination factor NusB [Peptococcaceae bacterium]|nr:transcription antitermination factor NusB [Peptococcaceae bacterium]